MPVRATRISVRPARTGDAPALAELHVAAWRAAYRDLMPADFLARLSAPDAHVRWRERIERAETGVRVATIDGEIVGCATLGPASDATDTSTVEIRSLNVHPLHWGEGAGTALWRALVEELRHAGYRTVVLHSLAGNVRARRFYLRHGFAAQPERARERDFGGAKLLEIRYVASLAGPDPAASRAVASAR